MTFKAVVLTGFFLLTVSLAAAKDMPKIESDQQMNDFSLSGYGERGKKSWDLTGRTADIFANTVALDKVNGNLYGATDQIKLTADKGDFNKVNGKVHLEQNVVVTTSSGAKMTTDSLDWDRKKQLVSTKAPVNIQRDNMVADALGAVGEPQLKKVALEKDVRVSINPVADDKDKSPIGKEKITVTCDGPVEIDYEKNIASFYNNVKVDRLDSTIYSDRLDLYFIASQQGAPKQEKTDKDTPLAGSKIDRVVARGHVKVVQGDNISTSEEAVYSVVDRKIVLKGRPELIIYSTEGMESK
jgi:LPS export ABC transporter protein LptC